MWFWWWTWFLWCFFLYRGFLWWFFDGDSFHGCWWWFLWWFYGGFTNVVCKLFHRAIVTVTHLPFVHSWEPTYSWFFTYAIHRASNLYGAYQGCIACRIMSAARMYIYIYIIIWIFTHTHTRNIRKWFQNLLVDNLCFSTIRPSYVSLTVGTSIIHITIGENMYV